MSEKATTGISPSTTLGARVVTTARAAERLARRELLDPQEREVWCMELPEAVAGVIMPPLHEAVQCGSVICQLPPDGRSSVSSGTRGD